LCDNLLGRERPEGKTVGLLGLVRIRLRAIDTRGAAAVEFAIVGTIFMMLMLAAFEFGYMLFVQSVLDNAARDAARLILTGQAQTSGNAASSFSTLLCSDVGSMIPCGSVIYQAQVFNNWSTAQTAVNNPPPRDVNGNMVSQGFSAGTPGQILVVTVGYNYPFFTPWIGALVGGASQSAYLQSVVVFQNEPY
jgi:Flp pilus assembly protein TadG